jgi:hypothetical protein
MFQRNLDVHGWNLAGCAAFLLAGIFCQSLPSLYNWYPIAGVAKITVRAICFLLLAHTLVLSFVPLVWRLCGSVLMGLGAILLLFGSRNTLGLIGFLLFMNFVAELKINRIFRFVIGLLGIGIGLRLRALGYFSLGFWWCYVMWRRSFSRILESTEPKLRSWPCYLVSFAHQISPPFLLGPLASLWLPWKEFHQGMEFVQDRERSKQGALLAWFGISMLILHSLCKRYVNWMGTLSYDYTQLSQLHGYGLMHLSSGLSFFCFTYWQIAGLTALSAGAWNMVGCPIQYDFHFPFFSKSLLDFWKRYTFYAHHFFQRTVYLPVFLWVSRFLPVRAAIASGLIAVFLGAFTLVHVIDPIPEEVFQRTFSWQVSLNHSFWMLVFVIAGIGLNLLFSSLGKYYLKGRSWHTFLSWALCIPTMIFLCMFFYNAFAQLWMAWSNMQFLQSVMGWP